MHGLQGIQYQRVLYVLSFVLISFLVKAREGANEGPRVNFTEFCDPFFCGM